MKRYQCLACEYIYDPAVGDPDSGIAPGTAFEDIPDDWYCPLCGVDKSTFEAIEEQSSKKQSSDTDGPLLFYANTTQTASGAS